MKFLAKILGLPTKQQMIDLNNELMDMSFKYEEAIRGMLTVREDMATLRNDMKVLYEEKSQEMKNLRAELKKVKPVLKVEDPEAVKFIKGILSKHDHHMNTQQTFLEGKMHDLAKAEGKANSALAAANEAAIKVTNLVNALGFDESKPQEEVVEILRNNIQNLIKNTPKVETVVED